MTFDKDFRVTALFLIQNPNISFIFGDNGMRAGYGGAALLRDYDNAYGFITKKYPNNQDGSFYKPEEYQAVFDSEIEKLKKYIASSDYDHYLISKLGAGLANKYNIWEKVIEPNIRKDLVDFEDKISYLF